MPPARCWGLINDILDFSKVEAGKDGARPPAFPGDRLLRDLSVVLSVNVGSARRALLFDVDPRLPLALALVGDAIACSRFWSTWGNAVKFTESGEVVVRIRAGSHRTGSPFQRVGVRHRHRHCA